jgi:hypothetical protein
VALTQRIWLLHISVLIIVLISFAADAQVSIENVQLPYPLDQENIDFISQSKDGIYWFGGVDGLIRFDGLEAEKLLIRDISKPGLSHDQNVQSPMFEDDEGRLWFSTASAFHCYHIRKGTFSTHLIKENGQYIRGDYRPFYVDSLRRELLLQAGDQLWRWDITDHTYQKLAGPTNAVHFTVRGNSSDNS